MKTGVQKSYEAGWNEAIDKTINELRRIGYIIHPPDFDYLKKPEVEPRPQTYSCSNHCGRIHKGEHVHKWTPWQYGSPTHVCHCGATKIEPPEPSKPKMAFFVRKNGAIFEARPFSFTTPGQASCLGMGAEIRFQLIAPNVYLEL